MSLLSIARHPYVAITMKLATSFWDTVQTTAVCVAIELPGVVCSLNATAGDIEYMNSNTAMRI